MTSKEKAVAKLIGIAEAEVGYCEKATNSQLEDKTANAGNGNFTKYGAYFDTQRGEYEYYNGRKNGYDWCDQFVDWCFAQAFGLDIGRRMLHQPLQSLGAGCKYSAGYFRANGAWTNIAAKGCQIFFGPKYDESHTGIVVDVSADKVWTVEGNSSNRVMKRTYYLNDSNIAGYGIPDWSLCESQFEDLPPILDDPEPNYITWGESRNLIGVTLKAYCGDWIETIEDVPHKSVKSITRALLDLEAVDGGTPYAVNPDDIKMPYDILRSIIIGVRYTDKKIKLQEERIAKLEDRIAKLEARNG